MTSPEEYSASGHLLAGWVEVEGLVVVVLEPVVATVGEPVGGTVLALMVAGLGEFIAAGVPLATLLGLL